MTNAMPGLPIRDFLWKLFVNEASNLAGSGVGIVLKGPHSFATFYALTLNFLMSYKME